MIKKVKLPVILCINLILLLSACRQTTPDAPPATQTITSAVQTQPSTHPVTQTISPTITHTPTPDISPTPNPTPTPTFRQVFRSLSFTPLPPITESMSMSNTGLVQPVAVWGTGKVNCIELSPDGQILVIGTNIGAYIYHSLNYEVLAILQTPYPVQSLTFSNNNQLIGLGQENDTIDIYQRGSYDLLARITISGWDLPDHYQVDVYFSPDSARLISVIETSERIYVNNWETTSWQATHRFSVENGKASYINMGINLLGVLTDDSLSIQSLLVLEEATTLSLPTDGPELFWEQLSWDTSHIAPSSDGSFLIINNGQSIAQWQSTNDSLTSHLDDYPKTRVDLCYIAPFSCRNNQGGFSWECDESASPPPITLSALTPDNIMVLISLNNGSSEFRSTTDGFLAWDINTSFTDVTFSSSGDFFFGVQPDGTIEKRSSFDGGLIDTLDRHPTQLTDLGFSPDGSVLAVGFTDGWIRVYSTFDGQMLGVLNGSAFSLQFSPDGRLLAAGLDDGTVRVFELEAGRYFDLPDGHQDTVMDLAFSQDGDQILTGSQDCTVRSWNLTNRRLLQNNRPDSDNPFRILSIEQSPNTLAKYLIGNRNGLYAGTGTDFDQLLSQEFNFTDIALSADGRTLAVTGLSTWLFTDMTFPITKNPLALTLEQNFPGQTLSLTPDGDVLIIATHESLIFWSISNPRRYDITICSACATNIKVNGRKQSIIFKKPSLSIRTMKKVCSPCPIWDLGNR